jgi:predicted RNase H-like nuclease
MLESASWRAKKMIVLGLDAAWTPHHDSGCAVIAAESGIWTCLTSFSGRVASADVLAAAKSAAGTLPDVVSVDMPLARVPIVARRECDNALSRAFGGRGCAVHSSTPERPGRVSADLMCALSRAGYELAVCGTPFRRRQVIEVYPHIAAMQLLGSDYRVPYKVARMRKYWPDATPAERIKNVRRKQAQILAALKRKITDIPLRMPPAGSGPSELKRFEDALDGVICAWIGALYLGGKCQAYGDGDSAIWAPA